MIEQQQRLALLQAQHLLKKYRHTLLSIMPTRFVEEYQCLVETIDDVLAHTDQQGDRDDLSAT